MTVAAIRWTDSYGETHEDGICQRCLKEDRAFVIDTYRRDGNVANFKVHRDFEIEDECLFCLDD